MDLVGFVRSILYLSDGSGKEETAALALAVSSILYVRWCYDLFT